MNCDKALNTVYEDDFLPFTERLVLAFHVLLCGRCARALRDYECARELLKTGFFSPSPDFENVIMAKIYAETAEDEPESAAFDIPGGFSIYGWAIAGVIVVVSLALSFFGRDFLNIAASYGSSFLVPLGIMTGIFITAYASLFIGSHLKELSERFHLRHP